ncbi:MAG: TIGR03790 family protein, partial [Geopsychrobacter sp.]|nr:TIGR03790 family protein [Geopsychrobacter sp.]
MKGILFILLLTVASWSFAVEAQALMSAEVLVVVNKNSPESVELGSYYRQQRGIPVDNLIQLETSTAETCSRKIYKQQIAVPLRKFLEGKGHEQIRSIVLMFGLPLKITSDEKQQTAQTRRSSVDSELALVRLQNYPLDGWIKNPLFVGFRQQKNLLSVEDVLLVARLDGPDKKTVRRIIDDS